MKKEKQQISDERSLELALPGARLVHADLIEMPEPLGIFAGELYDRGVQYLNAFERLVSADPRSDLHACYFLLTHSIELFLKAYLAARGVSKRELRKQAIRHNIPALFDDVAKTDAPTIPNLKELIFSLHEMNEKHDFRYPTGFNLRVPPIEFCMETMLLFKAAVAPQINAERTRAQIKWAADTRHLKPYKIRWSD